MYESSCRVCQVDGKKAGKLDGDSKGIYVGESSRSMYERGKEHVKDGKDHGEDSHQWKHWTTEHPDLGGDPQFRLKIVKVFSDPLTRQLAEAVRIEQRGQNILNSKSEFSRCRVPRLTLETEGWKKEKEKFDEEPREGPDQHLLDLERLEESTRRQERKRKEEGQ